MRFYTPLLQQFKSYWQHFSNRAFTDERIASYLFETFESDLEGAQIEGLRFYVKKRIVTIHGTLYRELDHELVLKLASRIAGLKAIVDKMHVIEDVNKEDPCARILLLLNDKPETKRLIPA